MKNHILTALIFCSLNIFAQAEKISNVNDQIFKSFFLEDKRISYHKIADTVAFYGFSVRLDVIRVGDSTSIKDIVINDTIAYKFFDDFNFLKKINYVSVMGDANQSVIIIPVGIIVAYVNNPKTLTPTVPAESIMPKVLKMFAYDKLNKIGNSSYIYMNPVMCICSTKTYE